MDILKQSQLNIYSSSLTSIKSLIMSSRQEIT